MFSFYRLLEEIDKIEEDLGGTATDTSIGASSSSASGSINPYESFEKKKKPTKELDRLEEDRWMKSFGVNPSNRFAQQWKRLVQRAANLRRKERGKESTSGPPYSIDSFRNAQVMKKLAISARKKTK